MNFTTLAMGLTLIAVPEPSSRADLDLDLDLDLAADAGDENTETVPEDDVLALLERTERKANDDDPSQALESLGPALDTLARVEEFVEVQPSPSVAADAAPDPALVPNASRPRVQVDSRARTLQRATRRQRTGAVLMVVGAPLMLTGVGVGVASALALDNADDLGSILLPILGILVGPAAGITGLGTLIAGGAVYGSGVRRERRARRALDPSSMIIPVLTIDLDSARAGVAIRF